MWIAIEEPVRSFEIIEVIRIIYISQIRETVGSEAFFAFLENRNLNFLAIKIGNSPREAVNSQFWQGHKDLNPEPTVLE